MLNELTRRLRGLRLRWLRRRGLPVRTRHHRHTIEIDPRDEFIANELLVHGTWEEPLFSVVEQLDLAGRTAIDAGAHVGIYTLALSGLVGAEGCVIALEPDAEHFARLERNLRTNSASNVTALNCAAGAFPEKAWLQRSEPNLGGHRVVRFDTGAPVDVVRLDSLADRASVAFLKIDVEGSEDDVIRGSETIIRNSHGLTLLVELELDREESVRGAIRIVRFLDFTGYSGAFWNEEFHRLRSRDLASLARRFDRVNAFFSRDPTFFSRCLRIPVRSSSER